MGTYEDAVREERIAGRFSTTGGGSSSIGLYLSTYAWAVLERDRDSRRLSPPSASVFLTISISPKKMEMSGSKILPSGPILLQLQEHIPTAVVVFKLGIQERSKVSDAIGLCLFDLRHR